MVSCRKVFFAILRCQTSARFVPKAHPLRNIAQLCLGMCPAAGNKSRHPPPPGGLADGLVAQVKAKTDTQKVLDRLSPETRELSEPAFYKPVKEIVKKDQITLT